MTISIINISIAKLNIMGYSVATVASNSSHKLTSLTSLTSTIRLNRGFSTNSTLSQSSINTMSDTFQFTINNNSKFINNGIHFINIISITNLVRHDDNLNDIGHDETNGDRTSDDLY